MEKEIGKSVVWAYDCGVKCDIDDEIRGVINSAPLNI
jgi:hypothetical protein